MALRNIQDQLSRVPLLTYTEFMATDGHQLAGFSPDHQACYSVDLMMRDPMQSKVHYLHYLCYLARERPLCDWVAKLQTENDAKTYKTILNHSGAYHHYYGTPLHTLSAWSNSVAMAKCLVEHGADPNIMDYYQRRPGQEQMNSWFIPSFRVGCEVDDYGNEPEVDTAVKRDAADFADINNYLAQFQR